MSVREPLKQRLLKDERLSRMLDLADGMSLHLSALEDTLEYRVRCKRGRPQNVVVTGLSNFLAMPLTKLSKRGVSWFCELLMPEVERNLATVR